MLEDVLCMRSSGGRGDGGGGEELSAEQQLHTAHAPLLPGGHGRRGRLGHLRRRRRRADGRVRQRRRRRRAALGHGGLPRVLPKVSFSRHEN